MNILSYFTEIGFNYFLIFSIAYGMGNTGKIVQETIKY